jgi:hypothetical protein
MTPTHIDAHTFDVNFENIYVLVPELGHYRFKQLDIAAVHRDLGFRVSKTRAVQDVAIGGLAVVLHRAFECVHLHVIILNRQKDELSAPKSLHLSVQENSWPG